MIDLQKYKALFISEAREILTSFQSELLRVERQEAGREPIDAMFRAAHSLKGMAASMGYDGFSELAHALEDIGSDARLSGTMATAAVDLMLEGVDRLNSFVGLIEADNAAACFASDLVESIRALRAATAPATATSTATGGPAKTAPGDAAAAIDTGLTRILVCFSEQSQAPQARAFMLQRQIAKQVEMVESSPSTDDLRQGRFPDRRLYLTVRVKPAELERLLKLARGATDVERVEDLGPLQRRRSDSAPAEAESADAQRTVRVRTEILDEFIDSVGELLRARDRLRAVAERVDLPELTEIADEMVGLTKDIYDRVMAARMTPLSLLTDRLPRVVRDLARKAERPVELRIEGADIEVDRALLDELHSAVLHVVRNAVDHAHEGQAARAAAGKPEALTVTVRAARDRDHVLIEIEDDGGGIDPDVIRAAAVAAGTIDQQRAAALSDEEALELICAPGLSTAEKVTDTSGRGVGMDAVRSTAERLGGDLQIRSRLGHGTCFTLRLPLTMAIIGVLLVEVAPAVFAIPTNRVSHALDFDAALLRQAYGETRLRVDEELLPYYDLGELLGFCREQPAQDGTVVLVDEQAGAVAVRVDRIAGLQEVVVKPLGAPLAMLDYLAGAALLPDGRPAFILDMGKLVRGEAVAA
ncbi:MAG: chemotaxis protein CheA [Deltaproteobacteria bacterium]|nr:chemotaxis protein CheA [Deltaproteobacteria bacterium]